MIGLIAQQAVSLIAQQATSVDPPFVGTMPAYDAQCELVLTDRSHQTVTIMGRGTGEQRQTIMEINGVKFTADDRFSSLGDDGSGHEIVKEGLIVDGDSQKVIYRLDFQMPGPAPVQPIRLHYYQGPNGGQLFGVGYCSTVRVDQ